MKIAVDSYCYHRYFGEFYAELELPPQVTMSLDDFIDRAAQHGVSGVSIESFMLKDPSAKYLETLRGKLDATGLERVWAWGHPDGLCSGQRPQALDDLCRHIDIGKKLGANIMRVCAGGRRTRPNAWPDHKQALLPLLERASDYAAEQAMVLAIENHADLLADEMLEVIDDIGSPALRVCLDTANNLRMLEDPMQSIEKLAPYAVATHIKDVCAYRGNPRTFSFWPSVPLGQGIINIPRTLELLKRNNYQGLLALEIDYLHPAYQHRDGNEEAVIQESLDYLQTCLSSL